MADLFAKFEVNREPRWPILIRLACASLIIHATALASLMYVPSMRDAFNIAAMMGQLTYVDRPYAKTAVGEEVHIVSLEKFHYPAGYFAFQNQPPLATDNKSQDPFGARIISYGKAETSATPLPTPTPTPLPEPSPTLSAEPSPSVSANVVEKSEGEEQNPAQKEHTDVDKQLDTIATENNVVRPSETEVNTRPLKDWLARANQLKEKGQLDLGSTVEITIAATLTSNCKLAEPKLVQRSGDARLIDVAKDMVSAIGDSGMLSFLRDPSKIKDPDELRCDEIPLQLSVKLDQAEISARVESQADSPDRAAQMADGYSRLLAIGQLLKRGKDEELLYKSTRITSEGKQIVVSFTMPRQTAGEMLKKQLPKAG
ncbi:MAG TPA: hypothetical protein VI750_06670 [Pyrinomonadaceae bacterium]|nr:hypothetical protein [Pyrinomonadaceae bacterium]